MQNSTSIYQILKAIDVSYEKNNFNFEETLNLEKLKISERRLNLILEGLINDNLITGFSIENYGYNNSIPEIIEVSAPRLTIKGLDYLENNSTMKKVAKFLKEIKGFMP